MAVHFTLKYIILIHASINFNDQQPFLLLQKSRTFKEQNHETPIISPHASHANIAFVAFLSLDPSKFIFIATHLAIFPPSLEDQIY